MRPVRYFLADYSPEPREVHVSFRVTQKELNRIKQRAILYAGGNVGAYLRSAGKFYIPNEDTLLEEPIE